MEEECAVCNHPRAMRARIEAEFVAGTMTLLDVMNQMEEGTIDEIGVLIHFNDHGTVIEEEVARKRASEKSGPQIPNKSEPYLLEPLPDLLVEDESNQLEVLKYMLRIMKQKFEGMVLSKHVQALGTLSREIRETLKEIERVKKEGKRTLADKTSGLLEEHRQMNKFLMHNLCVEDLDKYQKFLRGEFETKSEVLRDGQDRALARADVSDS